MTHAGLTWRQLWNWLEYGIAPDVLDIPTSYNVPPTAPVPVIFRQDGQPRAALARWGLIPGWFRKETREWRAATFNARCEDVAGKPTFRGAYRHGRCLVPASGYYEWQAGQDGKQPYYIHPAGNAPALLLAGLFSSVRLPDYDGLTCTVLTEAARPELAGIHGRTPLMLSRDGAEAWLDGAEVEAVERLPSALLDWHRVGRAVGSVRNDDPELIEPLA
ncbi:SOS response-associated peptidase [Acidimangrovimonas pyrenivorans]|uniref:Abasic site processing protein n=1 Tax=Acidimangrovimonas pyrenivorans TaxID=2030798 RepID=A0ABV7ADU2_9RHOB